MDEFQTVVCAAPDRTTNMVVLEALQRLEFGGSICLTALDARTAESFEGVPHVTVVRPFQMAVYSIVDGLKAQMKANEDRK